MCTEIRGRVRSQYFFCYSVAQETFCYQRGGGEGVIQVTRFEIWKLALVTDHELWSLR